MPRKWVETGGFSPGFRWFPRPAGQVAEPHLCVCVPVSVRMVGRSLSELLVWVGVFYKVKPSMGHQRHPLPPTRFMSAVGVTSWVTLGWLPESLGPCINENPPSSVASAGLSPQGPQTAQSLLEVTEQRQIMDSAVKGPGSKSLLCHFLPE